MSSDGPQRRNYRGQAPAARKAQRRAKLLEAGLTQLGSGGWQATTVAAVCERARLTPRYFYESFADRDELLLAIFDAIVEEVTAAVVRSAPQNAADTVRATVSAFVTMAAGDPRKGKAAFTVAFGSEALMRRRFERMHWFAMQLARQAGAGRELGAGDARRLETASLIVAGGLIETMVAWLQGELAATAAQVIDDFTALASATLGAAVPAS